MKGLLRFELFKLRKRKSLYICTAVMLGILLLSLLASYAIYESMKEWMQEIGEDYSPSVISYVLSATSSANFTLIVGIFIALYVCEDFGQKTVKNIYSRGFSRSGVYFSKLIICAAYVVIAFVIIELFTLAMGSALFGYRAEEGHIFALLLGQLLVCLAYASFTFGIGFAVKKQGFVIAISIIAPTVISLILAIVDISIDKENFRLSNYWLDGISINLANPLCEIIDIVLGCILPIAYSVLFLTAGFFLYRKSEV